MGGAILPFPPPCFHSVPRKFILPLRKHEVFFSVRARTSERDLTDFNTCRQTRPVGHVYRSLFQKDARGHILNAEGQFESLLQVK